jgi:hypothetical protein
MNLKKSKIIVGRTEIVDFPELGLENIHAKIDSGAYSTAIHTHKVWVDKVDDTTYLNFELLDPEKEGYRKIIIRTANFSQRKVRSSNGRLENRYIIKTNILLGGKKRKTDLSLTNRGKMRYPVLVGRKVLKKGFLIDVSQENIHTK